MRGRGYGLYTNTPKSEVLQMRFLPIAITAAPLSLSIIRLISAAVAIPPTVIVGKPQNDGDHDTTTGVLLPVESRPQYRDTIQYKMVRG